MYLNSDDNQEITVINFTVIGHTQTHMYTDTHTHSHTHTNSLFDFVLHHSDALSLWILELVGGATKVTKHVVTSVMQQDILHLTGNKTGKKTTHRLGLGINQLD